MTSIIEKLTKRILSLPRSVRELEVDESELSAATEALRLYQRSMGRPLYYLTPHGIAMIENLDSPLAPIDGLLLHGIALRIGEK